MERQGLQDRLLNDSSIQYKSTYALECMKEDKNRQAKEINNSLTSFTQHFITFLLKQPDKTSEIQYASHSLNISKRRIYDILNVLDGIGYVQKLGKNLVKWIGNGAESQYSPEKSLLQTSFQQNKQDISKLKTQINGLKKKITKELTQNLHLNYIQAQDIQKLMQFLQADHLLLNSSPNNEKYEVTRKNILINDTTQTILQIQKC